MRKAREVVIPAQPERRETRVGEVVCDLCGRGGGQLNDYDQRVEWTTSDSRCNYIGVGMTLEESSKYPDGGSGNIYSFDCCPECFRSKIRPLFEAAGGVMHNKKIDY